MKRALLLLVSVLFLAGCGDEDLVTSKTFWIDNPTDKSINLTIDGRDHAIAAGEGKELDLEAGAHELVFEGNRVAFLVKPTSNFETVINPTFSTYVLYHEIYQLEGSADNEREFERVMKNYMHHYDFSPEEYADIPARPVNLLFIEQGLERWVYGLNQNFPESIESEDTLKYSVYTKLFRENDFFEYFGEEEFPEGFRFTPEPQSYTGLKPFTLVPEGAVSGCEKAEPVFAGWRARFNEIPQEKSPAKVVRAAREVFQAIPYQRFSDIDAVCSNSINRKLPKNNYDNLLRECRMRSMDMLFSNVYILE